MNNLELMQLDTLSRRRIIEDISTNFFVEAGAGSGKTTILVNRMVAMVEAGIDISKICAITFTKAAAGEFYERFQKKLIERSDAPSEESYASGQLGAPTELTRERCREAVKNIDLCFLGTIDSFCNMILSEHPAGAGIPSNSTVVSDPAAINEAYRKEYSAIQRGEYGDRLQALCKRFRSVCTNADNFFLVGISKILETRDCVHVYDKWEEQSFDSLFATEKAKLLPVLRTLIDHPELVDASTKTTAPALAALLENEKLLFGSWNDEISSVIYLLKSISKIRLLKEVDLSIFGAGACLFTAHEARGKIGWYELSDEVVELFTKTMPDIQYSVAMEFLCEAAERVALSLRRQGILSFFDYLLYLRDMLKADAAKEGKLIKHIFDRHSYFLIDEFQDTNPLQAEIFFYLTAKKPTENWRECVPKAGSLFIVGDPKQSIYRFRFADVSSFLCVKELFCGEVGEVLSLTRNFRSTYKLRSWFNTAFTDLLPEATPVQSRFEPIPLEEAPFSDGFFEGVYTYPVRTDNKAEKSDGGPSKVAKIIEQIVGNPEFLILPKPNSTPRMVEYGDIMLITCAKKEQADYMTEFSNKDIPFNVEGTVPFVGSSALVALTDLFTAIANPNDRQSFCAALTSPAFGFSLSALEALKSQGYLLRLTEDASKLESAEKLKEATLLLQGIYEKSSQLSAAALFSLLVNELKVFSFASANNMEYVYFVLELIRSKEASGEITSLPDGAEFLKRVVGNETDIERALCLTKEQNKVHIANLHKIKGLEAPVVILADGALGGKSAEISITRCEPQPLCHVFAIKDSFYHFAATCGFEAEKEAEEVIREAEKLRLLYVAATRARRVLFVADNKSAKIARAWEPFAKIAEGDFFELFGTPFSPAPKTTVSLSADELYAKGEEEQLDFSTLEDCSFELRRPSQIKLKGKTSSEDNFEDDFSSAPRTERVRRNAALVGTLVHSLMEALAASRNKANLEALVADLTREFDAEGEEYKNMLLRVGSTMRSGGFDQKSEAPKDLLSVLLSADEVYTELPFCRRTEEEGKTVLFHGIMDLVFKTGDEWFIVDYKTNLDPTDLDEKYRAQLDAYADAFFELTDNRATTYIYHIEVL